MQGACSPLHAELCRNLIVKILVLQFLTALRLVMPAWEDGSNEQKMRSKDRKFQEDLPPRLVELAVEFGKPKNTPFTR